MAQSDSRYHRGPRRHPAQRLIMKVRDPNGPIQVAPVGLLGLLSLKTGGQMPDAMRQDLQPTVDFEAWWLRAKRVLDNVNRGNSTNSGGYVDFSPNAIIVPESEWWYVHSYSVRGKVNSVGQVNSGFRLAMLFNALGTQRFRFIGEPAWTHTQLDSSPEYLFLAEGFWAPPGAHIGYYLTSATGGVLVTDVLGFDYTALPL